MHAFAHELLLAELEITQARVDHARRCGGRAAREVAAVDYQRVESVQRQFAEHRRPVYARSDNQNRDIRILAELCDSFFSVLAECADGFGPFMAARVRYAIYGTKNLPAVQYGSAITARLSARFGR